MISIGLARVINYKSGGAVIAPWEVDQLDDDWINAFVSNLPASIAEHNKKIDEIRSSFYAKNKVLH